MNAGLVTGYMLAVFAIQIVPGPGMLYILANGISGGPRGGVAAALGAATGIAIRTAALAAGLAALFDHAPLAYGALQVIGAGYLLWLAVEAFRHPAIAPEVGGARRGVGAGAVYVRAVVNNLANPKLMLFFVALLPQFVDRSLGHIAMQLAVLGIIFLVMGLALDIAIGVTAGRVGAMLRCHPRAARVAGRLAGVAFAALAARLILLREVA